MQPAEVNQGQPKEQGENPEKQTKNPASMEGQTFIASTRHSTLSACLIPGGPFPREVLTWFYVLSSIFASVERERGGNDEKWMEGAISVACSRNGLRQMVMQSEIQMDAIFHDDLRRGNWHEPVRGVYHRAIDSARPCEYPNGTYASYAGTHFQT